LLRKGRRTMLQYAALSLIHTIAPFPAQRFKLPLRQRVQNAQLPQTILAYTKLRGCFLASISCRSPIPDLRKLSNSCSWKKDRKRTLMCSGSPAWEVSPPPPPPPPRC